jgi:hypothetical protein
VAESRLSSFPRRYTGGSAGIRSWYHRNRLRIEALSGSIAYSVIYALRNSWKGCYAWVAGQVNICCQVILCD